jgi:hypothetical protein
MGPIESAESQSPDPAPRPKRTLRPRRVLGVGCLALCLVTCAAFGALVVALQSGPVEIALPGNSALKFGSDNFVLSNSSFQNGTTYYADFKAIGIRDILEIHDLKDTHSFEIVFHHATKDEQKEQRLLAVPSP